MSDTDPTMTDRLRENIARLTERQKQQRLDAPWGEKLSVRIACFTGSIRFVIIHLVIYGVWAALNLAGVVSFDKQLMFLATEASVEAIFLTTFVLISQNRIQAEADRRADLDLHINLLAEHELTKLAAVVERIAEKVGVGPIDPPLDEVKVDVEPVDVLDALDERRRAHGL
jgi:uncharacterized membrane protein